MTSTSPRVDRSLTKSVRRSSSKLIQAPFGSLRRKKAADDLDSSLTLEKEKATTVSLSSTLGDASSDELRKILQSPRLQHILSPKSWGNKSPNKLHPSPFSKSFDNKENSESSPTFSKSSPLSTSSSSLFSPSAAKKLPLQKNIKTSSEKISPKKKKGIGVAIRYPFKKKKTEPLKRKKSSVNLSSGFFKVPLRTLMERQQDPSTKIPSFLKQCFEFLIPNGLNVEGIFRQSPSQEELQLLMKLVDQGENVSLEGKDPHVVSGLVKCFFRQLPEPLLTYSMFDEWINAADHPDTIGELLKRLPLHNRILAKELFQLCYIISCNSSVNLMSASNLGVTNGPALLRREVDPPISQLVEETRKINVLVQKIIENYPTLFNQDDFTQNEEEAIDIVEDLDEDSFPVHDASEGTEVTEMEDDLEDDDVEVIDKDLEELKVNDELDEFF
eukprot:TRINITY_DN5689_c0_g1_i1.p1 TRINITY_DN5689_c0_g1~~TRINITY_DN5689_c0_g1_i1.p1  ORF type:complete len:443 (+),score=180.45 TRINITY_DN5689_c0_g1_i1:32-1360(+)